MRAHVVVSNPALSYDSICDCSEVVAGMHKYAGRLGYDNVEIELQQELGDRFFVEATCNGYSETWDRIPSLNDVGNYLFAALGNPKIGEPRKERTGVGRIPLPWADRDIDNNKVQYNISDKPPLPTYIAPPWTDAMSGMPRGLKSTVNVKSEVVSKTPRGPFWLFGENIDEDAA